MIENVKFQDDGSFSFNDLFIASLPKVERNNIVGIDVFPRKCELKVYYKHSVKETWGLELVDWIAKFLKDYQECLKHGDFTNMASQKKSKEKPRKYLYDREEYGKNSVRYYRKSENVCLKLMSQIVSVPIPKELVMRLYDEMQQDFLFV